MRFFSAIVLLVALIGSTGCSLFFGTDSKPCERDSDCGHTGFVCNEGMCEVRPTATSRCGNGVTEVGETCDGDCKTECESTACGPEVMVGSPDTCDVDCQPSSTEQPLCGIADGCCPSACDAMRDVDCSSVCGNGVEEPGELCDGLSCPTDCSDLEGTLCSPFELQGSINTCDAQCVQVTITECINDDGCCGGGCNANDDNDCGPICGNGVIESGELCDGAGCLSCNDGQACTIDAVLSGDATTCDVTCAHTPILNCVNDDGCCAPGCTPELDDDCSVTCGNGILEAPELCDGDCPTTCNDLVACTVDSLVGDADACSASCSHQLISSCQSGDGCCPTGCSFDTDADCPSGCGNNVLEPGETCELGSCPSECFDGNACTVDTLVGNPLSCTAACTFPEITQCEGGDGCCPAGCDSVSDSDCSDSCGDGILDDGETCDGDCPLSCDDANACTVDTMTGSADTCSVSCSYSEILVCVDGDNCCAAGCDSASDSDCSDSCGDAVLDPGELCDGDCPVSCDDANACTVDQLTGVPELCNVQCSNSPLTACVSGDLCCPPGCNGANDDDCPSECGNGIVEPGEACDGNCPTTCNDDIACTIDSVTGSAQACSLECVHTEQEFCIPTPDGCCPASCNANTDGDCVPFCGNDIVEGDEKCDGNCPLTCDDDNTCTVDSSRGDAADCSLECLYEEIVDFIDGDTCCPVDGNANVDSDCSPECGNGVVELGEICDGNCPLDCSDGNICTTDSTAGTIEGCDAVCVNTPISTCIPNDGCCAPGCNSNTDSDCEPQCGNGVVEGDELCDAGGESLTCDSDCTAVVCGDGVANAAANEVCDTAGDSATCNSDCTAAACGDGYTNTQAGEECDSVGESATCDSDCTNAICGDGQLNSAAGEVCDDGAGNSDTLQGACRTTCQPAGCGDGVKDIGEICDGGGDTPDCDADCSLVECGDQYTNTATEQCDDGNDITEDCDYGLIECTVCDQGCLEGPGIPHYCGDGVVDVAGGEECDRGEDNTLNCDYGEESCTVCTPSCELREGQVSLCGDGNLDSPSELCDDGENNGLLSCGYGFLSCQVCSTSCAFIPGIPAYCGDGIVHESFGEVCDDGDNESCGEGVGCAPDCTRVDNLCGDGIQECEEQCDYGDNNGLECEYGLVECLVCDYNCVPVPGFAEYCGDGVAQGDHGEDCDDEGESVDCNIDCSTRVCGDSIVNETAGEQCDDGNTVLETCAYGDNNCIICDPGCQQLDESRYCGNLVVNPEDGEVCDTGVTLGCDGDGCAADCSRFDDQCGDGIVECAEECDLGGANEAFPAFGGCTDSCEDGLAGHCGPGAIAFDSAVAMAIALANNLSDPNNITYDDVHGTSDSGQDLSVYELDLESSDVATLYGVDCLTQIETLRLDYNGSLGTNPGALDALLSVGSTLKRLYMSNAELTSVESMAALGVLDRLYLNGNSGLGSSGADLAPLGQLDNLKILYLTGCDLTQASGLEELVLIQQLYLDYNDLEDDSWAAVQGLGTLRSLILTGNKFTIVPAEVSDLVNLTRLSLRDNEISDFSNLIENLNFAPTELQLTGNLNGSHGGEATEAEKVAWCATQLPIFEELELRGSTVYHDCE